MIEGGVARDLRCAGGMIGAIFGRLLKAPSRARPGLVADRRSNHGMGSGPI